MTINTMSTSDADALNLFFNRKSLLLRTITLAIVDSEPKKNGHVWCIDVIPAIRQVQTVDGDRKNVDNAKIVNVPIACMSSKGLGLSVTIPLKKGDECWLAVVDRSIDNWQLAGGIQNQVDESVSRHHDLTDVIAIPSMLTLAALDEYNNDAVQIGNQDTKLTVNSNEIKMDNGSGNVALSGDTLTINANVVINGNTEQTGNVDVTGSSSATVSVSSPTIDATTSLKVAGKEQAGHKHLPGTYTAGTTPVTGESGEQS